MFSRTGCSREYQAAVVVQELAATILHAHTHEYRPVSDVTAERLPEVDVEYELKAAPLKVEAVHERAADQVNELQPVEDAGLVHRFRFPLLPTASSDMHTWEQRNLVNQKDS